MEHQLRRGIYRPNAQRLSISLAPLVAQRSLMFRVKTELATKASYAELTPTTDESPALYTLTGSPQIVSAVLTAISAVLSTAMSSASVYSQDSWRTPSPSVSVVEVDSRQMAAAFSPSIEWSVTAEGNNDNEFITKSLSILSVCPPPPDVSFPGVNEVNDTESRIKRDAMPSDANNAVHESVRSFSEVETPSPFGERLTKIKSRGQKIVRESPKRSKSSKAFRKAVARLSFQPSKRKLAHLQGADPGSISNSLRLPDFKLSEFRKSSMRYSSIF